MNLKLFRGRTNYDGDDRCEVWAGLGDLISYCFEAVPRFPECSTHQSSGSISSSPSFILSFSLTPLIDAVNIASYSFA